MHVLKSNVFSSLVLLLPSSSSSSVANSVTIQTRMKTISHSLLVHDSKSLTVTQKNKMKEGPFQFTVIGSTTVVFIFISHILLSPNFFGGRFHDAFLPDHIVARARSAAAAAAAPPPPVPRLFDHPEPNFSVFGHIGEYWSTLTVIPISGFLLLATAIRHEYPIILVMLYLHVAVMYTGAFVSHLTLVPLAFQCTVTAVVWNSLLAFYFFGDLVPAFLDCNSSRCNNKNKNMAGTTTLFLRNPWLRRVLAILGAVFSALTVAHLPYFLGPNGGFISLTIIQPPFVALGLASIAYIKFDSSNSEDGASQQQLANCPSVSLVFRSGVLLMSAMALSAVEAYVNPVIVNVFGHSFPVMHLTIHVVEQIGIYAYGVGIAGMHFFHVEGRREDVALVVGSTMYSGSDANCDHQMLREMTDNNTHRSSLSPSPSRHVALESSRCYGSWYLLPFVCTNVCGDNQDASLRFGAKVIDEHFQLLLKQQRQQQSKKKSEILSSSQSATLPIDLLLRAARCDPHSFYLGPSRWVDLKSVQPCSNETKIKAVFDPELIEHILGDNRNFSSNPFGNDDSRYVGLSTTSAALHARHVKILAPFFGDQRLRDLQPVFAEIAHTMANASFGDSCSSTTKQKNDNTKTNNNNVVWYAYRVVIANALAMFGLNRGFYLDLPTVDFVVHSSLQMVAAVAPVGGSGTRRRLTLPMLLRIGRSLIRATPPTLRLIWQLGWSESFKLFRPDTSVLYPLLGLDDAGGRGLRSSILSHPEAFEAAPSYFLFLHQLWQRNANESGSNIFSALQRANAANGIRVADGLSMVAQLLIGMTAANGIVQCIKRLLQTPQRPLLEFGRVLLPASLTNKNKNQNQNNIATLQHAKTICPETLSCIEPLGDEELRDIFDSDESVQHFVNEVLRVDASLQRMPRRVTGDVTLPDGTRLRAGDQLVLFIGAANLSDALGGAKVRPYTNEKDRAAALAKTLSFGRGMHRCIGRTLTQLDVTSGVEGFFKFFSEQQLNNNTSTIRSGSQKGKSKMSTTAANNNNNGVVVMTADAVIEVRNNITLDLRLCLHDIDVGNYGHVSAHVVSGPQQQSSGVK